MRGRNRFRIKINKNNTLFKNTSFRSWKRDLPELVQWFYERDIKTKKVQFYTEWWRPYGEQFIIISFSTKELLEEFESDWLKGKYT